MRYSGEAFQTDNFQDFWFESALFRSHPEFATGDVEANVIGPGRLLIRTQIPDVEVGDKDPIFEAWMTNLETRPAKQRNSVQSFTLEDISGIQALLEGVQYDVDAALDEDFEMP